jgi:hypothetical protein
MSDGLMSTMSCKAMRVKLSEQVADVDHLVAIGARSSGSKPPAEDAALVATLSTEQACIAWRQLPPLSSEARSH